MSSLEQSPVSSSETLLLRFTGHLHELVSETIYEGGVAMLPFDVGRSFAGTGVCAGRPPVTYHSSLHIATPAGTPTCRARVVPMGPTPRVTHLAAMRYARTLRSCGMHAPCGAAVCTHTLLMSCKHLPWVCCDSALPGSDCEVRMHLCILDLDVSRCVGVSMCVGVCVLCLCSG